MTIPVGYAPTYWVDSFRVREAGATGAYVDGYLRREAYWSEPDNEAYALAHASWTSFVEASGQGVVSYDAAGWESWLDVIARNDTAKAIYGRHYDAVASIRRDRELAELAAIELAKRGADYLPAEEMVRVGGLAKAVGISYADALAVYRTVAPGSAAYASLFPYTGNPAVQLEHYKAYMQGGNVLTAPELTVKLSPAVVNPNANDTSIFRVADATGVTPPVYIPSGYSRGAPIDLGGFPDPRGRDVIAAIAQPATDTSFDPVPGARKSNAALYAAIVVLAFGIGGN